MLYSCATVNFSVQSSYPEGARALLLMKHGALRVGVIASNNKIDFKSTEGKGHLSNPFVTTVFVEQSLALPGPA